MQIILDFPENLDIILSMSFEGNPEHLKMLMEAIEKKDISIWNDFNKNLRKKGELANLAGANLAGVNLVGADLRIADLFGAELRDANLHGANLKGAVLSGVALEMANLHEADMRGVQFTEKGEISFESYLDLASAQGLETAIFSNPSFLLEYIENIFNYILLSNSNEWSPFVYKVIDKIKLIRQIYSENQCSQQELIQVIQTITTELITYLKNHPKELYALIPRQFEELIAEILASYGWQVQLTPSTRDGGYDIYAISKDIAGVSTSWIIECKKYKPENKVSIDIARALWGVKQDLRIANAMLATTSWFTKDVHAYKASRYDLELKDYEGILEWINEYQPHPDGKLYIKDHKLVLPGEK